jgi:transposase
MGKPYSMDLRERVVAAVKTGGMSCNRAAKQFGVGISTVITRAGSLPPRTSPVCCQGAWPPTH